MANTTNYNWETPDDTDLVKDGAAAIRTLGNSVDTTTKALNPETTLGDIAYRSATSNTNTRLPIGSAGQVLTVAAGVPSWASPSDQTPLTTKGDVFTFSTVDARLGVGANGTVLTADSAETTGLKWATPSTGALTKINSSSFTSVASVTVDSVFSSTYTKYLIILKVQPSVDSSDLQMQLRYGSTTQTSSIYYGAAFRQNWSNTKADFGYTNAAQNTFENAMANTDPSLVYIYWDNVGNSSQTAYGFYSGAGGQSYAIYSGSMYVNSAQTYTGFLVKADSGNITGTWAVYGVQN